METGVNKDMFIRTWQENEKRIVDMIEKQQSMVEVLGFEKKDLGVVYRSAYNAFKAEDYAQAENLFLSLFVMDFKNYDFQLGLAAAYEAQEKFADAYSMYSMAMATKGQNPEILFRTGKCLLSMGDENTALLMFELAAEFDLTGSENKTANMIAMEKSKNFIKILRK